jgi:adenylylsulfate kinase
MILLLFGQPASGKTTLADALKSGFPSREDSPHGLISIDGDRWREVTRNTDYSREGRMRNLKAAFDMALYLEREGFFVLLSFVTPYAEMREHLRSRAQSFREVYLTYEGDRGRNTYFVHDFEEPTADVIRLDTGRLSPSECIETILQHIIQENPPLHGHHRTQEKTHR